MQRRSSTTVAKRADDDADLAAAAAKRVDDDTGLAAAAKRVDDDADLAAAAACAETLTFLHKFSASASNSASSSSPSPRGESSRRRTPNVVKSELSSEYAQRDENGRTFVRSDDVHDRSPQRWPLKRKMSNSNCADETIDRDAKSAPSPRKVPKVEGVSSPASYRISNPKCPAISSCVVFPVVHECCVLRKWPSESRYISLCA